MAGGFLNQGGPPDGLRRRSRAAALLTTTTALLTTFPSCSNDDSVRGPGREVVTPDAGTPAPLALTPGMHFRYRADLHFRDGSGGEFDGAYTLQLTIQSTADLGTRGASTLLVAGMGTTGPDQNWRSFAGFDSWVARLGPADPDDRIATAPVSVALNEVPRQPPYPKVLPPAGDLFLDLRAAGQIRSDFSTAFASLSPRAVDPSADLMGHWVLTFAGIDPSISEYYPTAAKHREVTLAYDPRGFLFELDEHLGTPDTPNTPNGRFTLTLQQGP